MLSFYLAALALSPSGAHPCRPLAGAAEFARTTTARWVLLGESEHGTVEQPWAAADLICALMRTGRPLIVAIEHPSTEQPLLDAYMASDGGAKARAALFASWNWDPRYADGKSSVAMLQFLDWLRVQRRLGRVRNVVAFDAGDSHGNADRNAKMTAALAALPLGTTGLAVALTGSYHARRTMPVENGAQVPVPGAALPRGATVSIVIRSRGGTAWACLREGCGIHSVGPGGGSKRGLAMQPTPDGLYDGTLDLGTGETASPPANAAPERWSPRSASPRVRSRLRLSPGWSSVAPLGFASRALQAKTIPRMVFSRPARLRLACAPQKTIPRMVFVWSG
jgi:hypothetical protein